MCIYRNVDECEEFERRVRSAKRACRSELSVSKGEWRKHGYATSDILSTAHLRDTLPRVAAADITHGVFVERYEHPRVPLIVTGLLDEWPAQQEWTEEKLLEHYADHKFKVRVGGWGWGEGGRAAWHFLYLYPSSCARINTCSSTPSDCACLLPVRASRTRTSPSTRSPPTHAPPRILTGGQR
jgi:hypothetical protein